MKLTREEIQALPPGRKLDALIAEHVMGLDMVEGQLPQLPRYYLTDYEKTIHRDVPLYSSDISAAWEVADKLKIAIIPQSSSAPDNLQYLARAEWDFRQNEIDVFAATAPEAISKVALLMILKL